MISKMRFCLFLLTIQAINAELTVSKVVVRTPHYNDVGLIFDLTVTNTIENNKRELLEFAVRSGSVCRIKICHNAFMENAGHLLGGSFGSIAAGATETVSLIWATLSLFNRVGSCSVVITSTNPQKVRSHIKHDVNFDTRFTTLDPDATGLRKDKNFKDCQNFDLDYLNKCRPVNCEERYFGRRNFFNKTKKRCEEVPRCVGSMVYDPFANECVDPHATLTVDDIKDLKEGNYKEYDEWLKLIDEEESFEFDNDDHEVNPRNRKRENSADSDGETTNKIDDHTDIDKGESYVLVGVVKGTMLVLATLAIYIIICFIIFLIVSFVSKRQITDKKSVTFSETPSVSSRSIKLRSSSILKRRT